MHANTEHRNRTPVVIVCWIHDELIVQRDLCGKHRKAIIGLDDFFAARIWQLFVANQNAERAGIEIRLVDS